MAISANVIFDIRTTGSDTANGGGFDPSVTAGMFTDGAATSANTASPVFTSASYNFVAGDVGAWLFIASGTNWAAGWYQIASVAANAATLSAAVGVGVTLIINVPAYATTTIGCASVASPTGATWTIDYSQQNAAQFSYTDLASAGAGLTVSSAAFPFGRQQVGNMLVVASGTNFTAGNYIIASVAAGVATVTGAGNITTGAGASGVGGLGGAMATLGKAGSRQVGGSKFFIKSGTYTLTSSTNNVAGGPLSVTIGVSAGNVSFALGWDTIRACSATVSAANRPVIDVASRTSVSAMSQGAITFVGRFNVTGLAGVGTTGVSQSGNYAQMFEINIEGCRTGVSMGGGTAIIGRKLLITGFSTVGISAGSGAYLYDCEIHTGTNSAVSIGAANCTFERVLVYGITGAAAFAGIADGYKAVNCSVYSVGLFGFDMRGIGIQLVNCHVENAGGLGYHTTGAVPSNRLISCSGYNNTAGNYIVADIMNVENFVAITAGSAFTNPGSSDFSLNNIASRGALLRGAGNPQAFPRGLTQNREDIGAAQHVATASGGLLVNPGMSGGMRG